MLPSPFCLQPQASNPGLDRLRARLGVLAAVLTIASLAILPSFVS